MKTMKKLFISVGLIASCALLMGCGQSSGVGSAAKSSSVQALTGTGTVTNTNYTNPSILPATISVAAGTQTTFTANGGLPPYTYSVYYTSVAGAAIVGSTGVFTAPGSAGTVHIKVQDSAGGVAYSVVTVTGSGTTTSLGILREYYSPGTDTFTVPAGVTRLFVTVQGGGGGAGRNTCASGVTCFYGAGAGGAGGLAQGYVTVVPGTTYPVVVAAGGDTGSQGGTSRFNGTSIYATGGQSGAPYSTGTDLGGAGGQGYNGATQNLTGNAGSSGATGGAGVSAYGTGGGGYNGYGAGSSGGDSTMNRAGKGGFVVIYY